MGKADKICAGPKNSYKNLKSALKKKEVGGVRTPQPDYNGLFITPFPVSSCQSFFFSGRNSQNVTVTKKKNHPKTPVTFSPCWRGDRGVWVFLQEPEGGSGGRSYRPSSEVSPRPLSPGPVWAVPWPEFPANAGLSPYCFHSHISTWMVENLDF